jgi:Trypsin-co-occurring domain 1
MKRIISMPLEAGGTVELEIEDGESSPVMRGSPQQVIEKTVGSFEAALTKVKPVAVAIVEQFAGAIRGTTSVKVKFGLKFNAEAGAIIASLGSEANFEIELRWAPVGSSNM